MLVLGKVVAHEISLQSMSLEICHFPCVDIKEEYSRVDRYRGADKSLARPGRKEANDSVRMARISFGALPCRKNNLMTARVSMLLKSRASLTSF